MKNTFEPMFVYTDCDDPFIVNTLAELGDWWARYDKVGAEARRNDDGTYSIWDKSHQSGWECCRNATGETELAAWEAMGTLALMSERVLTATATELRECIDEFRDDEDEADRVARWQTMLDELNAAS